VLWFWEVMRALPVDLRSMVLQFVTGNERPPLTGEGLGDLSPAFPPSSLSLTLPSPIMSLFRVSPEPFTREGLREVFLEVPIHPYRLAPSPLPVLSRFPVPFPRSPSLSTLPLRSSRSARPHTSLSRCPTSPPSLLPYLLTITLHPCPVPLLLLRFPPAPSHSHSTSNSLWYAPFGTLDLPISSPLRRSTVLPSVVSLRYPPSSVVVYTQRRESGGSGFETRSGLIPHASLL
jgi:hypothetical protein